MARPVKQYEAHLSARQAGRDIAKERGWKLMSVDPAHDAPPDWGAIRAAIVAEVGDVE